MTYLITIGILIILSLVMYGFRKRIKRSILKRKIRTRKENRLKFDYDDKNQLQVIKTIERIMRDPKSSLHHINSNDNYYIVNGDVSVLFNAKYATVLNGKFNNGTMLFESIYKELQEKFHNRLRSDVSRISDKIDGQLERINTNINENLQIKFKENESIIIKSDVPIEDFLGLPRKKDDKK